MSDVAEQPKTAKRSRKVPAAKSTQADSPDISSTAEGSTPMRAESRPESSRQQPAPSADADVPAEQSRQIGNPLFDFKEVPMEIRAAAQQRFGADVRMGVPRENGLYKGEVFNTDRYLVQEVATRSVVFHDKQNMEFVDSRLKWCNENQRLNGAEVQVGYTGDQSKVYPYDRQRDQMEKVVRSLKKSATELGFGEAFGNQLDAAKGKSWERVKAARGAALEEAKARQAQRQARPAEAPDR
jgi:putative DNA primase/helicase